MVNGMSSQAIIYDLNQVTLPVPNPAELIQNLYEDLYKSNPDHFDEGDLANPDMDWLEDYGIAALYAYKFNKGCREMDPGIKGAFKMLDDPLMRRAIQSLAFAKVNDEDIELIVNGKFDIGYATEDFEAFLKYFFDVHDWSYNDRVEFIQFEKSAENKRFYKLAQEGDKPYLMWKLGLSPSRSFDDMLREMFNDSFYNFKERSRHDPELAQRWGTLAVKLSDKIDKLEKDDQSQQEFFQSFEFDTDSFETREPAIPGLDEVPEAPKPEEIGGLEDVIELETDDSITIEDLKTHGYNPKD